MVYNSAMRIFKYKFTRAIRIIIIVMLAIGVTAFGITLWQTIAYGLEHSAVKAFTIAKYVLSFIVSVALTVISVLFITSSYYAIDGKQLEMSFSFLKSKYNIDDIDAIILDRTADKLSIVFENESCLNVVIKPEQYSDFVQAVLNVKPSIEYSIKSKTSTGDDEEKK